MHKCLVLGILLWPQVVNGQDVSRIESDETCPACRITIERVVRLGQYDTVSIGQFSTVSTDTLGNYYVGSSYATGSILIFSAAGRLSRVIGRRGSGPGEISSAWWIPVIPKADSIMVLDSGNQRLSVFTADGRFVRSRFLPAGFSYLVLHDDVIAFTGLFGSRENFGYPVHLIHKDSKMIRSFGLGPTERILGPDDPDLVRHLSPSSEPGSFWMHHTASYIIELWRMDGRLIRRFERVTSLFPPRQRYDRWNPRPLDDFIAMRETPWGLLTITADEQEDWHLTLPMPARRGGEPRYPNMAELHKVHDTVFEFLDPKSGSVIKRGRHDTYFSGFVNDTTVYALHLDEVGRSYVDIWRVRLDTSEQHNLER